MLNKMIAAAAGIGVFAVVIAVGIFTPPPPDIASALGGYTYTQRYCAELGRQPRYYNIRDGQAAYNGGNSDSGWLLVQERGGHRVRVTGYSVNPNGAFVKSADLPWITPNVYGRFVPDANGNPIFYERSFYLGSYHYNQDSGGLRVRVEPGTPGAEAGEYLAVREYNTSPWSRYDQNTVSDGGVYVRWAYINWCN